MSYISYNSIHLIYKYAELNKSIKRNYWSMYDGDNDTASSLLILKFKTLITRLLSIFSSCFHLFVFFLFLRKNVSDRLNSSTYYLTTNILSEAKQFLYVFTLILNCKRVYNALIVREG